MSMPFALAVGAVLIHEGRRILFEQNLGDGVLLFRDCVDLSVYKPFDEAAGAHVVPTESWLHRQLAAGTVRDPAVRHRHAGDRQERFAGLDRAACIARDPKVEMKTRWAWAVLQAQTTRTDVAYAEFISDNLAEVGRAGEPKPAASSVRRWARDLDAGDGRTNELLNLAGREKGSSQLAPLNDDIVHQAAIYYWAERGASIADAEAFMSTEWAKLTPEQRLDGNEKRPSYETLRLRVRRLETRVTHEAKFGKASADRRYGASGEPVPVTRVLERVYVDGVELEQAVVMDDDWPLPAGKMKAVACIDALSTVIFDPAVFAGPYRSETSVQALINMMTPPTLTDEEYAAEPERAWAFGVPNTVVPDNDRALIGPGHVPGLNELGITLELPGTYHHDAKSPIENFNRFLKEGLRGLPGTIAGPRHPRHPQDDPLKDATLTREAMANIVRSKIRLWNTTPKKSLGWLSPLQVFHANVVANPRPLLCNPDLVRRSLARSVVNRELTGDGVFFDGIRYRGDLDIEDFLARNGRDTRFADRIADGAKCIVSIRVYDGDVDLIEVEDPEAGGFITLRSTQPTYTGMLTRWEHAQYKAMAARRKEKFKTEDQRLRSRAASLAEIDREAPSLPFKRRSAMAALYANAKVRRLSGAKGASKGFVRDIPETFFGIAPATGLRQDPPAPPPGPSTPAAKRTFPAPARAEGFHDGAVAGAAGNAPFDWDEVRDEDDAEPFPDAEDQASSWAVDDTTADEGDGL